MDEIDTMNPPPLDPVGGLYASMKNLSRKVSLLQDRLSDVLGLKESLAVWQRNVNVDKQLRLELNNRIRDIMKDMKPQDAKEFLKKSLYDYYSRRIDLGNALEKIGRMKPTANGLRIVVSSGGDGDSQGPASVSFDADVAKDIRKCLSEVSNIHVLLSNILHGTVCKDALDNKALADEQYIASLIKDLGLSDGERFASACGRFDEIMDELKSAERQMEKLKNRADASLNTPQAIEAREKLVSLQKRYASLKETPEAQADMAKLSEMRKRQRERSKACSYREIEKAISNRSELEALKKDIEKRSQDPRYVKSGRAEDDDFKLKRLQEVCASDAHRFKESDLQRVIGNQKALREQEDRVSSYTLTPEALALAKEIKTQRELVAEYKKSPEAQTAQALVEKRKASVLTLEQRLVSEAERFCNTRDMILDVVAMVINQMALRCRDLPEAVRDVFRKRPPKMAEDIIQANNQLSHNN